MKNDRILIKVLSKPPFKIGDEVTVFVECGLYLGRKERGWIRRIEEKTYLLGVLGYQVNIQKSVGEIVLPFRS